MRTGTLRVHHPLGHALTIEMGHLLEKQKVFKHNRTARPNRERILVVAHGTSSCRCQFLLIHDFLLCMRWIVVDQGSLNGAPGVEIGSLKNHGLLHEFHQRVRKKPSALLLLQV
jgi:hypothetical protein